MARYQLLVTFAAGSIFTLFIFQISLFVQKIEQPPKDDPKEMQRLASLEDQVHALRQSLQRLSVAQHDVEKNASESSSLMHTLQTSVTEKLALVMSWGEVFREHIKKDLRCPLDLSDFSQAAMTRWGWNFNMGTMNFGATTGFYGWADGKNVGSMSLKLPVSGELFFTLKNPHLAVDAENLVHVWLNNDHILRLGSGEVQRICLVVEADDILTLSEDYGQIQVSSMGITCSRKSLAGVSSVNSTGSDRETCTRDQTVWLPATRMCEQQKQLVRGQIDHVLNETRAIVRIDDTSAGNTYPQRIMSAHEVFLKPSGDASASCHAFEFRRQRIGIVLIIDAEFQMKFGPQILSQQCYAAWRGYDYVLLESKDYPDCKRFRGYRDFFFQKHCIVAEFLAQQVPGYVAAVIDGDVVAAVLERGLEQWTQVDADIQFYERIWCTEIAAGNYIVRNTPWARKFLLEWAGYVDDQPSGFASADNGAVHLHIVRTLELEGAEECGRLYHGMTGNLTQATELDHDLDGYFKFVNCTKRLLGPPRLWHARGGGRLALWGRAHFFVADGVYLAKASSEFFGPVFHHGIKEQSSVTDEYYSDISKCKLNKGRMHSREGFVEKVFVQVKWLTDYLTRLGVTFPTVSPGEAGNCSETFCFKPCVLTLSCPLLKPGDEPKPYQLCGKECE